MPTPFRTIAVVGSGAIGLYYGARLGLSGADVSFLMRSDLETVTRRGSVLIHEGPQTLELKPVRAFATAQGIGPVDLVLVTMKTTASDALAAIVPPLLHDNTTILTLQNGLGADEYLASLFGPERVLGGLAFIASTRTGPGEVKWYLGGAITVGEFGRSSTPRVNALAGQFRAAGVAVDAVDNLLEARWRKLVWNVPFNGLAVARNKTTNLICADPELANEVHELMREIQRAAASFGFRIDDEFLASRFSTTPPMGPYQPSSLVDFRAGREVEVEAIWGEPLRRAKANGVPMPRLERLYQELRRLTK